MRKVFLYSLFTILLIASCTDKNAYKLSGSFPNDDFEGKTVYLISLNQDILDSAKVKNKQFKFDGIAPVKSEVHFIQFDEQNQPAIFFPEPGKIELSFDSTFIPQVKGTPLNDNFQQFSNEIAQMFKSSMELLDTMSKELEEEKITEKEFSEKRESFLNKFQAKVYGFIKSNIQTPLGEYLFLDYSYYLKPEQMIELISMSEPEFKAMENVQRAEKIAVAQTASAAGKPYINIKGKNQDDKDVSLSDYVGKGKIVLVDFWASWCGPCIKTLPEMIKIYQKYKNKGFEIVGVSLDNEKTAWENATKKHQITWPQFSNLQGWTDEAAQAYGINSIPATFLIGKDGIIIEKNPEVKTLELKLEELLK